MEAETKSDVDYMIVDLFLESVTKVPTFKLKHLPLVVILKRQTKEEIWDQQEKQEEKNLMVQYEEFKEESLKYSIDLYPQVLEEKQSHLRIMFAIDNKDKNLYISLLEHKEGNSINTQEYRAS